MKKVSIILTLFLGLTLSFNAFAQVPPPPPPPPDHGETGNQNGGNAPIGGGLLLLLGLAGVYGVVKLKNFKKEELEE